MTFTSEFLKIILTRIPTGIQKQPVTSKAELLQEGILFRTQFPTLGIFINKKVGFPKKK